VSVAEGDLQEVGCARNSLRTNAKASEKVGWVLQYQAVCLTLPMFFAMYG
jgi:hypothetical protein